MSDEIKQEIVSIASVMAGKLCGCVHRHRQTEQSDRRDAEGNGEDTWQISFQSLWRSPFRSGGRPWNDRLMNETAELQKILEDNPDFDKLMKHPGDSQAGETLHGGEGFPGQGKRRLAEFLKIVVTKERYGSLKAIFAYLPNWSENRKEWEPHMGTQWS